MRPWRLTRLEREDAERVLSGLRSGLRISPLDDDEAGPSSCTVDALHALRVTYASVRDVDETTLRVRAAFALRAALRADAEARAEEMCATLTRGLRDSGAGPHAQSYALIIECVVCASCEWPFDPLGRRAMVGS